MHRRTARAVSSSSAALASRRALSEPSQMVCLHYFHLLSPKLTPFFASAASKTCKTCSAGAATCDSTGALTCSSASNIVVNKQCIAASAFSLYPGYSLADSFSSYSTVDGALFVRESSGDTMLTSIYCSKPCWPWSMRWPVQRQDTVEHLMGIAHCDQHGTGHHLHLHLTKGRRQQEQAHVLHQRERKGDGSAQGPMPQQRLQGP